MILLLKGETIWKKRTYLFDENSQITSCKAAMLTVFLQTKLGWRRYIICQTIKVLSWPLQQIVWLCSYCGYIVRENKSYYKDQSFRFALLFNEMQRVCRMGSLYTLNLLMLKAPYSISLRMYGNIPHWICTQYSTYWRPMHYLHSYWYWLLQDGLLQSCLMPD